MEVNIPKLKVKLDQLNTLIEFPKYYLSNFFCDLKNEVDVTFAQICINEQNATKIDEFKESWIKTIQKIDSFESKCFKNLSKNKLDKLLCHETNKLIRLELIRLDQT